jgi:hypothetical protein
MLMRSPSARCSAKRICVLTYSRKEKEMTLRNGDIALIKGMLKRGDRQSDIAAWFGVNGGRIAEINTGQRRPEVKTAKPEELPYVMSGRSALKAKETLLALRGLIDETLAEIESWDRHGNAD